MVCEFRVRQRHKIRFGADIQKLSQIAAAVRIVAVSFKPHVVNPVILSVRYVHRNVVVARNGGTMADNEILKITLFEPEPVVR